MSKRKVSVEDKIICCKSISGWIKKANGELPICLM